MDDILKKLAQIQASAPKAVKKKLTEDTSKRELAKKPTLKDVFNKLSETIAPGAKPLPVMDPTNKKAGMGFVTSTNPSVQNILKNLDPKDVQIVQAPGQPGQAQPAQQQGGQGQAMGATAQGGGAPANMAGGQAMREDDLEERDEGKPGKNFAKIAKSAGERYGSKAAGERVAGAVRAKLAKQGKLEETNTATTAQGGYVVKDGTKVKKFKTLRAAKAYAEQHGGKVSSEEAYVPEGAKVDRMVKHIEKSERKLGKSKEKASDIAWATANKRGMLDNKNKKVKEADIPSTQGIDTKGAGLGAGRSMTTLEAKEPQVEVIDNAFNRENYKDLIGKKYPKSKAPAYARVKEISEGAKPDFLDLDKDGNKKEPMKKAAADKKKQKVKESMNHRISAARLEGKSHGLKGHSHCGKNFEDLEERKAYCEGYKDGLDECYGMGVYEAAPAMPPATVGGMANQVLDELSSAALGAYMGKAAPSARALGDKEFAAGQKVYSPGSTPADAAAYRSAVSKRSGREAGMAMAASKLTGSQMGGMNARVPATEDDMEEGKLGKALTGAAMAATLAGGGMMAKGAYDYHKKDPAVSMSNYDMDRMVGKDFTKESDMEEGNAFSAALARTRKGDKFSVGGKSFTDRSNYDSKLGEGDFAFESWNTQLKNLINESDVNEGLSVSVSKGNHGAEDSVNINATGPESEQLMAIVKSAGLGIFGSEEPEAHTSSAMSIQPVDGGEPEANIDVVDGSDGMLSLMKKLGGVEQAGMDAGEGDEDYADEEGSEEHTCNECGMMETQCGCSHGKDQVDEVESEDQQEFEVAEANAPDTGADNSTNDTQGNAAANSALATADAGEDEEEGMQDQSVQESDDEEEEDDLEESFTFESFYKKLAFLESTEKEDKKAEKAGKKVTKDIEYDDKKDKKEKVDEWANKAGPGNTVSDTTFEQDIDFMTKVIAGGLNKPKSTGQTTIPVIAGQDNRTHDNPMDWATLAGIKKS